MLIDELSQEFWLNCFLATRFVPEEENGFTMTARAAVPSPGKLFQKHNHSSVPFYMPRYSSTL